jgi:hypothetical protein
MRRVLSAILLVVIWTAPLLAPAGGGNGIFSSAVSLKMKVLIDGKPTDRSYVVGYDVFFAQGKWNVIWKGVRINEIGGETNLMSVRWSSSDGEIKNIVVGEDSASFDLITVVGKKAVNSAVHVVVEKRGIMDPTPDVRGTSVYYDDVEKKTTTEEWVITDKLVLPSKEVFGFPEKWEPVMKKRK